ncbi:MAG: PEGA domain-containing protein [Polyangia bacterium]
MLRFRLSTISAALLAAFALAGCGDSSPTLSLTVSPPDAEVVVDGYRHPGGSPHEVVFKQPGSYRLEVRRNGYRPIEMQVTLAKGERAERTVELVPQSMQIAGGNDTDDTPPSPNEVPPTGSGVFDLHVSSTPSGAAVSLRDPGSPESRPIGMTPVSATLPDDRPTEITLSLAGYETMRKLVVAPADGGDVKLAANLQRKGRGGGGGQQPLVQDPPRPDEQQPKGALSVTTTPWTAVHVDGKPMGNTPLVRVSVAPGRHVVLMENRDLGKRRRKVIHVRPGEHVRLVESLD